MADNIKLPPIDPPLPIPDLTRDEFNAYKQTLFQEHVYGLIFHEADVGASPMELSDIIPTIPGLSSVLEKLGSSVSEFAAQVIQSFLINPPHDSVRISPIGRHFLISGGTLFRAPVPFQALSQPAQAACPPL